jgi:hypothetical protein
LNLLQLRSKNLQKIQFKYRKKKKKKVHTQEENINPGKEKAQESINAITKIQKEGITIIIRAKIMLIRSKR